MQNGALSLQSRRLTVSTDPIVVQHLMLMVGALLFTWTWTGPKHVSQPPASSG